MTSTVNLILDNLLKNGKTVHPHKLSEASTFFRAKSSCCFRKRDQVLRAWQVLRANPSSSGFPDWEADLMAEHQVRGCEVNPVASCSTARYAIIMYETHSSHSCWSSSQYLASWVTWVALNLSTMASPWGRRDVVQVLWTPRRRQHSLKKTKQTLGPGRNVTPLQPQSGWRLGSLGILRTSLLHGQKGTSL